MNPSFNTHEREAFGKTFALLKSVCDKIALNPNENHTKQLSEVLKCLKPKDVQTFQHYILFPMEVHLFNKNKDQTVCNLLGALKIVLSHTQISDFTIFLRTYSVIFLQIDDKETPGTISNVSEEVKLNAVQCNRQLFLSANEDILEKLYEREYYSKLCLGVYMCGQLAKNESFINLRIEALESILTMLQLHNGAEEGSKLLEKVADVVMLMVPGISSVCVTIANGSDTQNHKIIMLALRVWGRVTSLVMKDLESTKKQLPTVFKLLTNENNSYSSQSQEIHKPEAKNLEELNKEIGNQTRNEQWLTATAKQLLPVTRIMTKLKFHPHAKVRQELSISVNGVLTKSPISMSPSVSDLVNTLIILSQDGDSSVRKVSQNAVRNFADKCSDNTGKSLLEIVEESLYSLITRIPRILNGTDETAIETDLSLLCGYLSLLGKTHLPKVLISSQHLKRLLTALMQASTFDASNIALLEEVALRNVEDDTPVMETGWKKFKLCHSSKLQSKLEEACSILRECSDLTTLTHTLLDLFNTDSYNRKEYIFLINQIFASGPTGSLIPHIELAKTLLTSYVDPLVWYVPLTVEKGGAKSKQAAQHNVVQVCLLAEGVSKLANGLGPEHFSSLLLRCLYPLLEHAGSPLYMVSCAGLKSVKEIANLFKGGVSELVSNNVDYLSHHVSLRLQNIERNPHVLSVLTVIMKHSSIQVLPSLHEIINDVLVQSCDNFQDSNANNFLYVFHTFISCIQNWIGCEKVENLLETPLTEEISLAQEILNYHNTRMTADSFLFEDESNETHILSPEDFNRNKMEPEKEEEEVKCPDYISLTEDILKRTLHFLPSKDISRQILVLQILTGGVMVLEKWKDQLLPVVHKMWSPLVERFNHNNHPLLIQRAFSLLTTLAYCSQSFIKPRTLKHVIPSLCEILKRLAPESKLKDVGHAYRMSQNYKLQLCLLCGLGPLAVHMEFREKDIYTLLKTAQVYLSNLQPQPLQQAAVKMYQTLASTNPDIVWVNLVSLCPPEEGFIPPIPSLRTFKLESSVQSESIHYKKNVEGLLIFLRP